MARLFETTEIKRPTIYGGTQVSRQEDIPRQENIIETIKASLKKEYPIELPKVTESREFVAGQVSEAEQERSIYLENTKKEYQNYFLTQTELGQDKKWAEMIPQMKLSGLENLHNEYSEWQNQVQQQRIMQVGEQLGLDASMVEQLQRGYSPEELPAKLQLAGIYKTLLGTKHASATMVKQFGELLSPTQEPTLEEEIRAGDIPADRMKALEQLGLLPEGMEFKEELPTVEEKGEVFRKVLPEIEEGKYELKDLPIDYLLKYDLLTNVPTADLVGQGFLLQEGIEDIASEIQGGTPVEELITLLTETQGINENMAKLYILKAMEWLNEQQQ